MKLELFFDYICPYCYRGHRMFLELLPLYPGLEVVWRPCESHPRPENTYRHSDMAIQGMRYAWETLRLNAVPSYLAVPEGPDLKGRGPMIGSRDGIPVTRRELEQFLANLK